MLGDRCWTSIVTHSSSCVSRNISVEVKNFSYSKGFSGVHEFVVAELEHQRKRESPFSFV